MSELVSVIVSVYNIEAYLPKCLESVSRQTYKALDVIIIDDGSTDGSGAICDSFASKDSRVRVFHQENRGLWAVRNRGQQEALGDYLLFVDGDDYFHDDYVRLLFEAINKDGHQYPMAVCGFRRVYGEEADVTTKVAPAFSIKDRDQLIDMFFDPSAYWQLSSNWDKMYRKSCLDIPFQREYTRCQDMDSNLRAIFSKVDHAIFISSVLYFYRIREGQLTRTKDYLLLKYDCISSVYYNCFSNIPQSLKKHKHHLLLALYRVLATWRGGIISGELKDESLETISFYEKQTILAFLFCKNIPLRHKLSKLMLLHFPSIANKISEIKIKDTFFM